MSKEGTKTLFEAVRKAILDQIGVDTDIAAFPGLLDSAARAAVDAIRETHDLVPKCRDT